MPDILGGLGSIFDRLRDTILGTRDELLGQPDPYTRILESEQHAIYDIAQTEHTTYSVGFDDRDELQAYVAGQVDIYEAGFIRIEYLDEDGNTRYFQTPLLASQFLDVDEAVSEAGANYDVASVVSVSVGYVSPL